jgi:hypothetical protein
VSMHFIKNIVICLTDLCMLICSQLIMIYSFYSSNMKISCLTRHLNSDLLF